MCCWSVDVMTFWVFRQVYAELVALGVITPREEVTPPTVPMDYNWARVSIIAAHQCKLRVSTLENIPKSK